MPNFDNRIYVGTDLGKVSGVVTSLPAGYVLGEERWEALKKYRLVFNAGGASGAIGNVMASVGSTGPYSVTVTTASDSNHHVNAVVVANSTATTGSFFWGLVQGRTALTTGNTSAATGQAIFISAAGVVVPFSALTITTTLNNYPIGMCLGAATQVTGMTGLSNVLGGDYRINLG